MQFRKKRVPPHFASPEYAKFIRDLRGHDGKVGMVRLIACNLLNYFILFYFILFYFFYFILFQYFILFYFILIFYFILFYLISKFDF